MKRTLARGAALGVAVFVLATARPALAQPSSTAALDRWHYGERYGFGGKRKSIARFSEEDQQLLAKLIREYTTMNNAANVTIHVNAPHEVHMAPYSQFFPWHASYIANLEKWLAAKGHVRFVPLPKYVPAKGNKIPRALAVDAAGRLIVQNLEPGTLDQWVQAGLASDKLSRFVHDVRPLKNGKLDETIPDSQILSDCAVWPHNDTHNTIGGTMASMRSPSVPIFWLYHAFIDDIQHEWKRLKKAGKTVPRVPADLPEIKTARTSRMKVDRHDGMVVLTSSATGARYMVRPDGTSFDALAGLLREAEGKEVVVLGYFDEDSKTVRLRRIDIEKPMDGPGSSVAAFDKDGKKLGEIGGMSAVRVVGLSADGKSYKVIFGHRPGFGLQFGYVPRAKLPLAPTSVGIAGALGGHDHHHE